MNQKRFLTADEVFQLFGVDTEALDKFVESGDVQALPDLGTFKYRREDFAKLVQAGRLSPRTAGEMFQMDSDGNIPFLKLKQEDEGIKFDDDVEFIELDEDALNEQADPSSWTSRTPPEAGNRLGDSDETEAPASMATSREVPVIDFDDDSADGATDFELSLADSDSNVRLVNDDGTIDLDEPDVPASTSDSDVRLEGPVSASPRSQEKKSASDSDVRFMKIAGAPESDSDVTIVAGLQSPSTAPVSGDSYISLGNPSTKKVDSDSDVVLVATPSNLEQRPVKPSAKKPDSDSDVQLSNPQVDSVKNFSGTDDFFSSVLADTDSDVKLSDSSIRLEPTVVPTPTPPPAPALSIAAETYRDDDDQTMSTESSTPNPVEDFELRLDPISAAADDGAFDLEPGEDDDADSYAKTIEFAVSDPEASTLALDGGLEFADQTSITESEIVIESADPDSGITLAADDSGISLESSTMDSEIALAGVSDDSGITLDQGESDSGITLQSARTDSDISLDDMNGDSGIALGSMDLDSGISLESQGADSGIMLEPDDSGIRFESAGDSGITLVGADSGISLEDDGDDLHATFADQDVVGAESKDVSETDTFDLRDSGFDVSLAESDHTMEMQFDDDDDSSDTAATVVDRGKSKGTSGSKSMDLSEAFQLDEPLEVEDLDISEDLDAAVGSEFSDEFASIDDVEEEVLEASEDDFSAEGFSAAEDADDDLLQPKSSPSVKRRAGPYEPAWGMAAVGPIICASVLMAVTVTVLWGGIATMWTGGEAPGPAGMLISILGGLI